MMVFKMYLLSNMAVLDIQPLVFGGIPLGVSIGATMPVNKSLDPIGSMGPWCIYRCIYPLKIN